MFPPPPKHPICFRPYLSSAHKQILGKTLDYLKFRSANFFEVGQLKKILQALEQKMLLKNAILALPHMFWPHIADCFQKKVWGMFWYNYFAKQIFFLKKSCPTSKNPNYVQILIEFWPIFINWVWPHMFWPDMANFFQKTFWKMF